MKNGPFMIAALGTAVVTATVAFGATIATTDANNSFDLASATTYSGGALPATSDTIRLANGGKTYTSSADMTFGMIYFGGNNQTIDLSSTPGRTITLGGSSGIYPYGNTRSLALVGGKYLFSNRGTLQVTVSGNPNTRVSLSGGAVVTNAGTVYVRSGATDTAGPTLSLSGAGTLLDTINIDDNYSGPIAYSFTGDPTETGVGIDVSGGAIIRTHASGQYGGCFNPSGVTIVRGAGSRIEAVTRGYAYIGSKQPGTIVHVTDGGNFTSEIQLFVSDSATRGDNRLRVDNGGTANINGVNISGRNERPNGTNNWLEAGPGGSVTIDHDLSIGGTNNHVAVSNGALAVNGTLRIGIFTSDRGNDVRVAGASSSLSFNQSFLFNAGSGHRFTLDDGATLSRGGGFYFTNGATDDADARHGHLLEVMGGASLTMTGNLFFRDYGAGRVASNGNTLRVASGGSVSCQGIYLRCADNAIVISNGTVVCADFFTAGGNETGNGGAVFQSSGGRIVLDGATPRLQCNGTGVFNDGVTILFRPAKSGFSLVPLSCGGISTDGTATLAFEGVRELQKSLRETRTYTLAEATGARGTVAFTDAQIAEANGTLPEKCRLSKSADGKSLLLKVSVELPTKIVIR